MFETLVAYLTERISTCSSQETRLARARMFDELRYTRGMIEAYEDIRELLEEDDEFHDYDTLSNYLHNQIIEWKRLAKESHAFYEAKANAYTMAKSQLKLLQDDKKGGSHD